MNEISIYTRAYSVKSAIRDFFWQIFIDFAILGILFSIYLLILGVYNFIFNDHINQSIYIIINSAFIVCFVFSFTKSICSLFYPLFFRISNKRKGILKDIQNKSILFYMSRQYFSMVYSDIIPDLMVMDKKTIELIVGMYSKTKGDTDILSNKCRYQFICYYYYHSRDFYIKRLLNSNRQSKKNISVKDTFSLIDNYNKILKIERSPFFIIGSPVIYLNQEYIVVSSYTHIKNKNNVYDLLCVDPYNQHTMSRVEEKDLIFNTKISKDYEKLHLFNGK